MASSKDTADSKPKREKKTEASEDHGEPFEFTWPASDLEEWSKPGASLPDRVQRDPTIQEEIRRWKQLPQRERRKRLREERPMDQRIASGNIQRYSQAKEWCQREQSDLEKRKASLQEAMAGDISETRRREVEEELVEVERRIQEAIKEQEGYQKTIDRYEQRLQRTSRQQDEESRQYLAEAMKKGVIEVHNIKCVISGAAGVGKSCLELLLLGKKPPKVRRSTGCAEPIRAVSGTRIQFFDGGWKVVSEEDLKEMIAHSIPIFCDSLDEDIPAEQLESLLQQQLSSDTTQHKATPTSQDQAIPTTPSTQGKDKTSSSPSEAPQQATTSVLNDLIKRMNKVALPETTFGATKESEKLKDLSGSNWIHLIDSGGQPEFYDLLPIFIRHASSIVFVQRLCDSLKDHPVVEFYDEEGNCVGEPYHYPLTCEEILKCMVRTLHSHPTEGKHSNIMVAGTFRDKESDCHETQAKKNEMLFNLLHPHFPNDLVLYGAPRKLIFPLNTKHPDEDDQRVAQLLRQAIERSAPDPVKIPISWYLLELALRRLAALLRRRVLSRKECLSIAQQLGFSENEFHAALTHFDELNLCLYYPNVLPNVVFSDPQVPLDKASELVQRTYQLREPEQVRQPQKSLCQPPILVAALESKWLRFRDQGIVRHEFLEKFPRHYKDKLFTPDDLLHLFEHLLILAPLSPGEYFMPSLLQRLPSEELDAHRVSSSAAAPLLIRFPLGWPRNGVFCCLVVFLINHCKWEAVLPDTGSPILMAKNCIKFRLPSCTATVTLIDSYAYFEIHIEAPPSVCYRNCPSIQATIFDGIDKAAITLHYNNSKPCAAFLCPHSNHSGQTSSKESHAAITKDQEYWQCTVENRYGELTKREKVWFGTWTETKGYVPPQSYQHYHQHPTSFPVGPTHQPTYPQPSHSPPGNQYPPQEHPPPTKIPRLDSSHHTIILPHQYTGARVQEQSCQANKLDFPSVDSSHHTIILPQQYTGAHVQGPNYQAKELDVKNIVNVLHEAEFADGDWELLGLQLIKHADLTTIKANRHGEASLCMMDMVSQWLRNELEPSWNKLAEAVEKVGKYGKATAQVVQRKAGIGSW